MQLRTVPTFFGGEKWLSFREEGLHFTYTSGASRLEVDDAHKLKLAALQQGVGFKV